MAEHEDMETRIQMEENRTVPGRQNVEAVGGMRTLPYIFSNEICVRFANAGSHNNLVRYLTVKLNLPYVRASNLLSGFDGLSSLFPLIGALIADTFAGRFWTIIVASLIYQMGMITLTVSASVPSLHPPACPLKQDCKEASHGQILVFCLSLLIMSVGIGGIGPCLSTFAADQFDMRRSAVKARRWNFFNRYSFGTSLASLLALTVNAYIQDHAGWGWGLGIPTVAWIIGIVIFCVGSPKYLKPEPAGSPLVRVAQVLVSALRKRKLALPRDSSVLYRNRELDAPISVNGTLVHTQQFKWFDKATIITEGDRENLSNPNLWRLNTVHRVEELKSVLRMVPIWATALFNGAASSQLHNYAIIQAGTMNQHLGHLEIPPVTMQVFSILTLAVGLVIYERAFVPLARRFTSKPAGITPLQRIGVGSGITILATIVSAAVETKRKNVASKHNLHASIPISIFWLAPQNVLHGVANVFTAVGLAEFMYDQSPESMRSTSQGLFGAVTGFGNFLGIVVIKLVREITGPENNWLPSRNINKGKLDYLYYLSATIQAVGVVYFVVVARLYVSKPIEDPQNDDTADAAID